MSVVVIGMKVPKTCSGCPFCEGYICRRTGIDKRLGSLISICEESRKIERKKDD